MVPEPGILLLLVLLGTWAGIDGTSTGQFMISRPVVAASVAGWLAGDPASGALIGLILEALYLTVLPVGASRYPEIGPAAVVSGALFARGGGGDAGAMLTVVLFAVTWAWFSGFTVRQLRQANIRLMDGFSDTPDVAGTLARRHGTALALDVVRAAAVTTTGLVVLLLLLYLTASLTAISGRAANAVLWSLAAAGIAAGVHLFGEGRAWFFVAGTTCGLLFLILV
jgi:mannose/fructose/N-acetylgalactosamine-specific phosphotransferase system component IIC